MNARTALLFWRRVQSDPELREVILGVDSSDAIARLGLTPDELEVARHLRAHRAAAVDGVQAFHLRLARRVATIIRTYCPLTESLLVARGQDLDDLVRRYNAATGFQDDGPYFHRSGASFLSYVEHQTALPAAMPELIDVMRVEQGKLAMLGALARLPESEWHMRSPAPPLADGVRYQRSPNSAVVPVAYDITALLVDPDQGARAAMERRPRTILIYLQSTEEQVGFAVLADTARAVWDALREPMTIAEVLAHPRLQPADRAADKAADRVRSAISQFSRLGIIRPADTNVRPDRST
jgi:hypothetical protein